jgi:glycine/serine hydroxymethyltransferase
MKEPEMREIGKMIAAIVHDPASEEVRDDIKRRVVELTAKFPLYARRLKDNLRSQAIAAD